MEKVPSLPTQTSLFPVGFPRPLPLAGLKDVDSNVSGGFNQALTPFLANVSSGMPDGVQQMHQMSFSFLFSYKVLAGKVMDFDL